MWPALGKRGSERRAWLEQVILAHQLLEDCRAHSRRQGLLAGRHGRAAPSGPLFLEQLVHAAESGSGRGWY